MLAFSKFQIFTNKPFKATSSTTVNHSKEHLFLEAKELSNVKCENEMTGQDI